MSDRRRNIRALQWLFVIGVFAWALSIDWVSKTEEVFSEPRKTPPRRFPRQPRQQPSSPLAIPELRAFTFDTTAVSVSVNPMKDRLPGFVISEIHYHPADSGEDQEFVELTNASLEDQDIGGWALTEGVRFHFPDNTILQAGESRVVCRDEGGFRAAFGTGPLVMGEFEGGLRNSGEAIELRDSDGRRVLKVAFSDQEPWDGEADGSGASLQLRGLNDPEADALAWHAAFPNPGRFTALPVDTEPSLFGIGHRPKKPRLGEPISIVAHFRGALESLQLRLEANGSEQAIPIPLKATNETGVSQILVDLGTIPEGVLVRYWFEGLAVNGAERRWPSAGRAIPNDAFVVGTEEMKPVLPTFDLFMSGPDMERLHQRHRFDETVPVTLVHQGEVFDRLRMRIRGAYARGWPKKAYKIFFHPEQRFRGRSRVNLNSGWRDPAIVREILAYRIYEQVGSPSLQSRLVRLNVNGEFWGLYVEVEQPDKRFLEDVGLEDAALYKADSPSNGSDERFYSTEQEYRFHYRKETKEEQPFSDLMTFSETLSRAEDDSPIWSDSAVVDRFVNYLCGTAIVQNWDGFNKNHYIGFEQGDAFRWFFLPWDLDRTLGDSWNWKFRETRLSPWLGTSREPGVTGWNRVFDAALQRPEIREAYQNRMRTVLTESVTEPWIEAQIAEFHRQLAPDATRDRQKWGGDQAWENELQMMKEVLLERRRFLLTRFAAP